MYGFVTVVFLLVCFFLIAIILLQQGKGSDIGAAFGGGGSTTLFGPAGAGNILTKATAWGSVAFFVLAIALGRLGATRGDESLIPMSEEAQEAASPAGATEMPGDDLDVEALERQLESEGGLPTEVTEPPAAEEPEAPADGEAEMAAPAEAEAVEAPAPEAAPEEPPVEPSEPAAPVDPTQGLPTDIEAPPAD